MGDLMRREIESSVASSANKALGDYLVCVGDLSCQLDLPDVIAKRRINLGQQLSNVDVRGDLDELPIVSNSVDVFLLCLTLEYTASPHALLREINRCITADGSLIINGFHPLSMANVARFIPLADNHSLRYARYLSPFRLFDWLRLLDFDVVSLQRYCVSSLVFKNNAWLAGRYNDWCQQHLTSVASMYTVIAKKRTIPLTWQHQRQRTRAQLSPSVSHYREM